MRLMLHRKWHTNRIYTRRKPRKRVLKNVILLKIIQKHSKHTKPDQFWIDRNSRCWCTRLFRWGCAPTRWQKSSGKVYFLTNTLTTGDKNPSKMMKKLFLERFLAWRIFQKLKTRIFAQNTSISEGSPLLILGNRSPKWARFLNGASLI